MANLGVVYFISGSWLESAKIFSSVWKFKRNGCCHESIYVFEPMPKVLILPIILIKTKARAKWIEVY